MTTLIEKNQPCLHCPAFGKSTLKECLPSTLEEVHHLKQPVTFRKGEYIFREGEPTTHLFCQYSGEITVTKRNKAGKEFLVRTTSPGAMIELKTILNDENHCSTAQAATDVQACSIPKNKFVELVKSDNRLYLGLIQKICMLIESVETKMKQPA